MNTDRRWQDVRPRVEQEMLDGQRAALQRELDLEAEGEWVERAGIRVVGQFQPAQSRRTVHQGEAAVAGEAVLGEAMACPWWSSRSSTSRPTMGNNTGA